MEVINFDTDKVDQLLQRTKHHFLLPDCHYRKRGSASYIVREVHSVRKRERERDTERERERWK